VTVLLGALADQVEGKAQPIMPSLGPLLAGATEAIRDAGPALDPLMRVHLQGRVAVYADLVGRLTQLAHDVETPIAVEPGVSPA
jgi:hypothetical protein